jgi:hypothetical protein
MARFDDSTGKSAAELEREVEVQRGRVSHTIDEIQTRLSPGQIIDQLIGTSGAQDFAQNMGRQIRDNPLPVALLGASLLWLMAGRNPVGAMMPHRQGDGQAGDGLIHEPYYDDPGIGGNGSAGRDGMGDKVKDAAAGIRDAASGIGDRLWDAKDQASRTVHDMRDGLGAARHSIGEAAGAVSGQMRSLGGQMSDVQDSVGRFLRDQPLVAGALAFAAGAALGAALPVTGKERELVGDAAADVVSGIKEAARPMVEKARGLVGDALEEGKDMLEDVKEKAGEDYTHLKDDLASIVSPTEGSSSR